MGSISGADPQHYRVVHFETSDRAYRVLHPGATLFQQISPRLARVNRQTPVAHEGCGSRMPDHCVQGELCAR
jgi:hypothetical protein